MICQTRTMVRSSIGVYVAEEQDFYREIYRSSFETDTAFSFLGMTSNEDETTLQQVLANEKPDVLLVGAKSLSPELFQELESLTSVNPRTGMVVLVTSISADWTMPNSCTILLSRLPGDRSFWTRPSPTLY
jgi:DNA-binding NarL/FixJ family response regulator